MPTFVKSYAKTLLLSTEWIKIIVCENENGSREEMEQTRRSLVKLTFTNNRFPQRRKKSITSAKYSFVSIATFSIATQLFMDHRNNGFFFDDQHNHSLDRLNGVGKIDIRPHETPKSTKHLLQKKQKEEKNEKFLPHSVQMKGFKRPDSRHFPSLFRSFSTCLFCHNFVDIFCGN